MYTCYTVLNVFQGSLKAICPPAYPLFCPQKGSQGPQKTFDGPFSTFGGPQKGLQGSQNTKYWSSEELRRSF